MENRFGRHRFGLTGAPPAAIAAPIDLRGDVTGHSLAEWRASSGRLYARLDYADVAAWQAWLPLPLGDQERQGRGAGVARISPTGEARAGVADLVLVDVQATLAPELQELTLARLEGASAGAATAASARSSPSTWRSAARAAPASIRPISSWCCVMPTGARPDDRPDGVQQPATRAARCRWPRACPCRSAGGTSSRATTRAARSPRVICSGRASATAPTSFVASTRFTDLGIDAQDRLPGLSGLSGSFEATEQGGSLILQSRPCRSTCRACLRSRSRWTACAAVSAGSATTPAVAVTLTGLSFANAQLAGTASGTYQTAPAGPGSDRSQRAAAARRRARRLSLRAGDRARLGARLAAARTRKRSASDVRLRLSGDLADFPFADGKKGQFLVTAKAQGVTLDYADALAADDRHRRRRALRGRAHEHRRPERAVLRRRGRRPPRRRSPICARPTRC